MAGVVGANSSNTGPIGLPPAFVPSPKIGMRTSSGSKSASGNVAPPLTPPATHLPLLLSALHLRVEIARRVAAHFGHSDLQHDLLRAADGHQVDHLAGFLVRSLRAAAFSCSNMIFSLAVAACSR